MGDRASSGGVRNIRAMFEAKVEDTSPPSRGRSPANSEATSSASRPISKVRTSFVAVERSGQLGPILGLRKASDTNETGSGGARTPSMSAESRAKGLDGTAMAETPVPLANVKEEEGYLKAREGTEASASASKILNGTPNGNVKKEGSKGLVEDDTTTDLGTVLKGSPFESDSPQKAKQPATPKPDSSKQTTATSTKPSSVKAAVKAFADTASAAKPKVEAKTTASRPPAISTKVATSSKASSGPQSARSAKSDKAIKTPTTPKDPSQAKPARLPTTKPASPKQPAAAKEANKTTAPTKAPVRKTSRLSIATEPYGRSTATAPTATSTAKTAPSKAPAAASTSTTSKKPANQISQGGFVKPAPKSPTRPVRLPAAATASTAASSAKLGQASRSPSRASNVSSGRRLSLTSRPAPRQSAVGIKPKASRQSLATSTTSRGERPGSRASLAGKGTGEGFLDRMMRPTQASASKTHEKLEVKSPPRGKSVPRPKRTSEVASSRGENEHTKQTTVKAKEKPADISPTDSAPKTMEQKPPVARTEETKILEPKFEAPEREPKSEEKSEDFVEEPPEAQETSIDEPAEAETVQPKQQAEPQAEDTPAATETETPQVPDVGTDAGSEAPKNEPTSIEQPDDPDGDASKIAESVAV